MTAHPFRIDVTDTAPWEVPGVAADLRGFFAELP
jgi:hypothetical protein